MVLKLYYKQVIIYSVLLAPAALKLRPIFQFVRYPYVLRLQILN
jgi:hypothetical protein